MDAVEEIKSNLDIADIVGEYLPLRPAGTGSFKTLCPFHQEKSPSFFVNRPRQSWHCFGCDEGGDLISFVMRMEGMEFRDALAHLADKAGVILPQFNAKTSGERKRLQEINEMAAKFFRYTLLKSPEAEHARAYAESRAIDVLTGDLFKIGYASKSWDALTKHLRSQGVVNTEIIKAGLGIERNNKSGVYDRFRDRLMFSISDVHGNVVGFTGRLLDPDAKEQKYVNTPETPVYKKSQILYGLDKAKGEIKSNDLAVICEGNMDVVSSHACGVTNVICSSGTALTTEQLKLIARFTKKLAIAFDDDSAGTAATLRGLDLARAQDFQIHVISLPPEAGKDPDEVIQKDPELWERAIRNAKDILDWMFEKSFRGRNLSSAEDKRTIARELLPEIKRIPDPIASDHWLKKLADALQTNESALRDAMKNVRVHKHEEQKSEGKPPVDSEKRYPDRSLDLSERFLAILVKYPHFFEHLKDVQSSTIHPDVEELYEILKKSYDSSQFKEPFDPASLPADQHTQELLNYLAIRLDRDYEDQSENTLDREFHVLRDTLRSHARDTKRRDIEEQMREAELSGDRTRVNELVQAYQELIS